MTSRYKRQRLDFIPFGGQYMMSPAPSMMAQGNSSTVSKGAKKRFSPRSRGKRIVRLIKKVIQGEAEKKEVLTSVSATATGTQSFITLLNGIAQGTTALTRVGDEVTHCYIEISIGITNFVDTNAVAAALIQGDYGFWAIVLDRQPNGATPAYTDIFDNSLGVGTGTDFRITTTYQDRFKILSRNEWSVGCAGIDNGTATFVSGAQPYHIKEYVDLSKLGISNPLDQKANYSNTGATIASIDSGAIFFVWASTNTNADNNTTLKGQCKYRFSDI